MSLSEIHTSFCPFIIIDKFPSQSLNVTFKLRAHKQNPTFRRRQTDMRLVVIVMDGVRSPLQSCWHLGQGQRQSPQLPSTTLIVIRQLNHWLQTTVADWLQSCGLQHFFLFCRRHRRHFSRHQVTTKLQPATNQHLMVGDKSKSISNNQSIAG